MRFEMPIPWKRKGAEEALSASEQDVVPERLGSLERLAEPADTIGKDSAAEFPEGEELARAILERTEVSSHELEAEVARRYGEEFFDSLRMKAASWRKTMFEQGTDAVHFLDSKGVRLGDWSTRLIEGGHAALDDLEVRRIGLPKSKLGRYCLASVLGTVGTVAPGGFFTLLPASFLIANRDPERASQRFQRFDRKDGKARPAAEKKRL